MPAKKLMIQSFFAHLFGWSERRTWIWVLGTDSVRNATIWSIYERRTPETRSTCVCAYSAISWKRTTTSRWPSTITCLQKSNNEKTKYNPDIIHNFSSSESNIWFMGPWIVLLPLVIYLLAYKSSCNHMWMESVSEKEKCSKPLSLWVKVKSRTLSVGNRVVTA